MNDISTLCVLAMTIFLLAVLLRGISNQVLLLSSLCATLYFICKKPPSPPPNSRRLPNTNNSGNSGDVSKIKDNLVKKEDEAKNISDEISLQNGAALSKIYGRRPQKSIDDAMYIHKQRIGDRDRQATINQVKGRRNNVYEPYYCQELSEASNTRWWENDSVLVGQLEKNQLASVDMGRFNNDAEDMDGIYS